MVAEGDVRPKRPGGSKGASLCVVSGNSRFGNDLQAVAETEAGSERAPRHAIFGAEPVTRDGLLTRALGICQSLPERAA
jgi:hypothetical protein